MQVLYRLSYVGPIFRFLDNRRRRPAGLILLIPRADLERETGFEPATLSLEG